MQGAPQALLVFLAMSSGLLTVRSNMVIAQKSVTRHKSITTVSDRDIETNTVALGHRIFETVNI